MKLNAKISFSLVLFVFYSNVWAFNTQRQQSDGEALPNYKWRLMAMVKNNLKINKDHKHDQQSVRLPKDSEHSGRKINIPIVSSTNSVRDIFSRHKSDTVLESASKLTEYLFGNYRRRRNEESHNRHRRKVVNFNLHPSRKWTLPIRFKFDPNQTKEEKRKIYEVMSAWKNLTCIRFQEIEDENPHGTIIRFTRDNSRGCCSNAVGRDTNSGTEQIINLAQQCYSFGVITHELGHVIGFYHEQVRPDRDDFVTIHDATIEIKHRNNFQIQNANEIDTYGIPYDYSSIMHYENNAFSKNGSYTIVTRDTDYMSTIGQRFQMSFADILAANMAYCQHECSVPLEFPCKNGGYQDPNNCDRCLCPDGYEGPMCSFIMKSVGESICGGDYYIKDGGMGNITSPSYPRPYGDGQECSWLLEASGGGRIQAHFDGTFGLPCSRDTRLCHDWVEIRAEKDKSVTSARFCCDDTPKVTFTSEDNKILILFRVNSNKDTEGYSRRGFNIKYRQVS